MKVKAIIDFNDLQEGIHRVAGKSEWECSKERADYLLKHNAIKIIEEEPVKIEYDINLDGKKIAETIIKQQEIKKEEKPKKSKKKKSNKK